MPTKDETLIASVTVARIMRDGEERLVIHARDAVGCPLTHSTAYDVLVRGCWELDGDHRADA